MSDYTVHTTDGEFQVNGAADVERDPKGNVLFLDGDGQEIAEFDRDSYVGREYRGESDGGD